MGKIIINGNTIFQSAKNASEVEHINSDGTVDNVQNKLNKIEQTTIRLNDVKLDTVNSKLNYIINVPSDKAKVYNLGTKTDIKSLFPNDYQRFTVDNFIIKNSYSNVSSSLTIEGSYAAVKNSSVSTTVTKNVNYNSETGQLIINGNLTMVPRATNYYNNQNFSIPNGVSNMTYEIYLIDGVINMLS